MSTVVVVRKNNTVAIACDTQTSFGSAVCPGPAVKYPDKIVEFDSNYIGTVGAAAHTNVLQSVFNRFPGGIQLHSERHIFESFLKLMPILKTEYFLNSHEDDSEYETSQMTCLIANKHGIFGIYGIRDVYTYTQFWAIGSGSRFAIGAMHANYSRYEDAASIAKTGVEAGCIYDSSSGYPIICHEIEMAGNSTKVPKGHRELNRV